MPSRVCIRRGRCIKLASASGALQEGVINTKDTIFCSGVMYLPNKFFPDDPKLAQPFYCWYRPGHGTVNNWSRASRNRPIFSFTNSTVAFRDFTTPLGQSLASEYMRLFGYGAASGIDLPGESDGLVPDPRGNSAISMNSGRRATPTTWQSVRALCFRRRCKSWTQRRRLQMAAPCIALISRAHCQCQRWALDPAPDTCRRQNSPARHAGSLADSHTPRAGRRRSSCRRPARA